MAEFSVDVHIKCIEAVVNEGMELQMTIEKWGLNIKARTPQYQRLYRLISKKKAEKRAQASVK